MKGHLRILALSLLALIVALAGLMGVLDILPQPGTPSEGPDNGDGEYDGNGDGNGDDNGDADNDQDGDCDGNGDDNGDGDSTVLGFMPTAICLRGMSPPRRPIFEVVGAATTSYLKTVSATVYQDDVWRSDDSARSDTYEGETLQPSVVLYHTKTEDTISVVSLMPPSSGMTPLPTSLYPVQVYADVRLLHFPEEQVFHSVEGLPDKYSFRTVHYAFSGSTLRSAELADQARYLQLPTNVTARTRELARTITSGVAAPYEKARVIENYLRSSHTYDPFYEPAPEGWEPNDWFLFEEKRGVCAHFNSAFVVLSRSVGIPSRLAGGFMIRPQDDKQVVYTDQAHAWAEVYFEDLGWYEFDATGFGMDVSLPTVTEITFVESVVKKGHVYEVRGHVRDLSGQPAGGQWVQVYINAEKEAEGGLLIGEGATDSLGLFSIDMTISSTMDVGDYHILAHCLGSARYQESWSDPPVKVIAATDITMEGLPLRVKVQDPVMVNGTLAEEFGEPIAGKRIEVYLAGGLVAELATDDNGQFTWEQSFDRAGDYSLRAAFSGTDYYLGSSWEEGFQVLIPTAIGLGFPGVTPDSEATAGKPVLISGSLFEDSTGTPIPGQEVEVFINDEPYHYSVATDEAGSFHIQHTFDGEGRYQVEARFSSVPYYWESSTTDELNVVSAPGSSRQQPLALVLILALSGVCGFLIYWWQRRRRLAVVPGAAAPRVTEPVSVPQRGTPAKMADLAIDFPQIAGPLPDVWGLDEPLDIVCHLENPRDRVVAETPLDVYIGSERIARLSLDNSGVAKIRHTFTQKGQHEVIARTSEALSIGDAPARRTIRIVDYREEIVDLFRNLVNWFREVGTELDAELTPREIQHRVLDAGARVPERPLDRAVSCFEEADYSLHPVDRGSYEEMYLAQAEIRKHGGEHTGEPGEP